MSSAQFTIYLEPNEPDFPLTHRIKRILVGNQEVRAQSAQIDFQANGCDSLILRIPIRYVSFALEDTEEMEYATSVDRSTNQNIHS